LVLLHGAGPGGVPSFDLPVPGYSLGEDFAKRGLRVFLMDVRGWGSSTKPREVDEPPQNSAPLVSTKEAADDIETGVRWVVRRIPRRLHCSDGRVAVTGHALTRAVGERV
jgi:alpha-beta hydrolase superfamily lysophospholipase